MDKVVPHISLCALSDSFRQGFLFSFPDWFGIKKWDDTCIEKVMCMKKSSNEFVVIGLMLFALFFGAGNLIFPVFMGQNAGWNTPYASIGFLITGVGIPFASVLAICYSGLNLKELASRVHPVYGVFFSCALYLTIGPFFAIPRTSAVSFEIAVSPFLNESNKDMGLYAFVFIFFALTWWLSITPSKLVTRIGKFMTPLLLIFLAIMLGSAFLFPMGSEMAPIDSYDTPMKAFSSALVEGYNTMDCLAGLVFGVIVMEAIHTYGLVSNEESAKTALRSGLISTVFMAIIYASLCYLGASSVAVLGHLDNGAPVLAGSAHFYFGNSGTMILGMTVILACLTTSIGLTASCAAFFHTLVPKFSHKLWASFFVVLSFGIALFGLSAIIKGAIPVLLFLYPLSIALILLTFTHRYFGGSQKVYLCATIFTLLPALYDALKFLKISMGSLDTVMASLPLASYSMSWLLFFVAGVVVGYLWKKISSQ